MSLRMRKSLACLTGLLMCGIGGGCYQHVVRTEGPGTTSNAQVYEPNLANENAASSETTTKKAPNQTVPSKKAPAHP